MGFIRRLFGGADALGQQDHSPGGEYTIEAGPKEFRGQRRSNYKARGATDNRLLKRSCESLIGMTGGMLADGYLSDDEIHFLNVWLDDNPDLASTWPGEVIYTRVKDVLADGVITEDERKYLHDTLSKLIGGDFHETGAAFGATSLPVDSVNRVEIEGSNFCFTGQFIYGTRAACQRAVEQRGGVPLSNVRKDLDYLVIGAMASHAWANTSHGRKIEKAMDYKSDGLEILIVSEDTWVASLNEPASTP